MPTHQSFQHRRLVRSVVVDVKVRVLFQARRDEVHERLELCLLLVSGEGPKPSVFGLRMDPAEQILEPLVLIVGVTLEVKEDVPVGGNWKRREPLPLDHGCEQLVSRRLGFPPLQLDARLFANSLGRDRADAVQPGCNRQGQVCEGSQGLNRTLYQ